MRINSIITLLAAALSLSLTFGCMTPKTKIDSAYIQKIIDSMPPDTGGELQLDKGIYTINATINIHSRVYISGSGESTVLKASESFDGPFFKNSNKKGDSKIFLSSMKLEGKQAKTKIAQPAIYFKNVKGATIQNIIIENISGPGILLENCDSIKTVNSTFKQCANDEKAKAVICLTASVDCIVAENKITSPKKCGIMLLEKSDKNVLDENTVSGASAGIDLQSSGQNLVKGNVISDSKNGISLALTNDSALLGNRINNASGIGILLTEDKGSKLLRNKIGNTSGTAAVQIIDSKGAVLQNNEISSFAGDGISVKNSKGLKMLFNIFDKKKKNIFNIDSKSKVELEAINGIKKDN